MRKSLSIALIAGIVVCTTAQAAIYRWVDDQGVVHYTETPPPAGNQDRGQRMRTLGAPTGAVEQGRQRSEAVKQQLEAIQTQRQETTKEQAQQQAEATRRASSCSAARENLAKLQIQTNRRVRDAEGNVTVMTEEERAKHIDEAHQVIEKNCE